LNVEGLLQLSQSRLDDKSFVKEVINSSFEDKLSIWKFLRTEFVENHNLEYFDRYIIPLMQPIIDKYKNKLAEYSTYREDFEQDVIIDIFTHFSQYNPDYNGKKYLGNVYIENRIRTIYRKYTRTIEKNRKMVSNESSQDLDLFNSVLCDKNSLHGTHWCSGTQTVSAEDTVIGAIIEAEVLAKYHELDGQYSKYYAKKKVIDWAKEHDYL
jgi:hypothetical protein